MNWQAYCDLTRINRPIGIYLLLWPTLTALWMAGQGDLDWQINTVFILGVILMRSAGCVINDFADRRIDGLVARTKSRPLADGRLTSRQALACFTLLILAAFILALTLNQQAFLMSFIALGLAVLYPFTKRWLWYPQLFLALAFSWAIPMAFMAYQTSLPLICWVLFCLNLLWVFAYDTMYAMADRPDDIKAGIKSSARWLGRNDVWICITLQVIMVSGFVALGISFSYPMIVLCAVIGYGFVYYQFKLIRDRSPNQCLKAFLNNHWLGLVIFTGVLCTY